LVGLGGVFERDREHGVLADVLVYQFVAAHCGATVMRSELITVGELVAVS
jgi:hypothetical protein